MSKVKLSEKVKPLYSDILISMITEYAGETASGIIVPEESRKGSVLDVQKVMAIGPNVTQVEVGDEVKLKMINLMTRDTKWVKGKTSNAHDEVQETGLILDPTRMFEIDGVLYFLIREGDIAYKVLKQEE